MQRTSRPPLSYQPVIVVLPGAEWNLATRRSNQGFQRFWETVADPLWSLIWLDSGTPWWAVDLSERLDQEGIQPQRGVILIAFSAGVVGALSWLVLPGSMERCLGVMAFDGWCVPLPQSCRVARFSHDVFTHLNGLMFRGGEKQFYADPSVSHETLWTNPDGVFGWITGEGIPFRSSAAHFLRETLQTWMALDL